MCRLVVYDAELLCHPAFPYQVFVTHTHGDHAHGLIRMESQMKLPNISVPSPTVKIVRKFLDASTAFTLQAKKNKEEHWMKSYELHECLSGDLFVVEKGGKQFLVKVARVDHRYASSALVRPL